MNNSKSLRDSIRDFSWVLQGYLRGKVLRDTAYRPKFNGSYYHFPYPLDTLDPRCMTLMRWWGHTPITLQDILKLEAKKTRAYRKSATLAAAPAIAAAAETERSLGLSPVIGLASRSPRTKNATPRCRILITDRPGRTSGLPKKRTYLGECHGRPGWMQLEAPDGHKFRRRSSDRLGYA